MKNEVKNGIILTVVVVLIILITYFTTAVFMTGEFMKEKNKAENNNSSVNDEYSDSFTDNKIIASNTFLQKENKYIVLFYSEGTVSKEVKDASEGYDSEEKLYIVNMDEAINKYVKSDEENKLATNYEELKINKTTLIIIENGKISSYISDEPQIISALK